MYKKWLSVQGQIARSAQVFCKAPSKLAAQSCLTDFKSHLSTFTPVVFMLSPALSELVSQQEQVRTPHVKLS